MQCISGLKNPKPMFLTQEMPTLNLKKDSCVFTVAENYVSHNSTEVC